MNNKKQQEGVFHYQSSWFSRLFAKYGQYDVVAVNRQNVSLTSSGKPQSIEFEGNQGVGQLDID